MLFNKKLFFLLLLVGIFLLTSCDSAVEYTLYIDIEPAQSGNVNIENETTFPESTIVELVPQAESGWWFDKWAGENGAEVIEKEVSYELLMDSDKHLTAVFRELSSDATLSDLKLEGASYYRDPSYPPPPFGTPVFHPNVSHYRTTAIVNEQESIIVRPVSNDEKATITVNGQNLPSTGEIEIYLEVGVTDILIDVESEDSLNQLTYTISAERSYWELIAPLVEAPNVIEPYSVSIFHDGEHLWLGFNDPDNHYHGRVMKLVNQQWEYVGGKTFTDEETKFFQLYVEGENAFVAFREPPPPGEPIYAGSASVMTLVDGEWEYVGDKEFTSGYSGQYSLFVEDGIPYLTFRRSTQVGVKSYCEEQGWYLVGGRMLGNHVAFPDVFVANGIVYAAYSDSGGVVKKFAGSEWEVVGSEPFTPQSASTLSLYVDNGTPYVAFLDAHGLAKPISVMKYNGTDWEFVGERFFTDIGSSHPQMIVENGELFVGYRNTYNSKGPEIKTFNGTEWELVAGGIQGAYFYGGMAFGNGQIFINAFRPIFRETTYFNIRAFDY